MDTSELRTRSVTTTAGRPRSLRIDIRSIHENNENAASFLTREEVLKALHDEGITKEDLQGLEIQGKHTAYVVFKTFGTRNKFLNKTITTRGQRLNLDHPNPTFNRQRTTLVHVYNYPIDGEPHDLSTVLGQYGKRIGDFTIASDSYGLATGERTIVMEIKKDIPSYVFVGKHQVRIRYYQQP